MHAPRQQAFFLQRAARFREVLCNAAFDIRTSWVGALVLKEYLVNFAAAVTVALDGGDLLAVP